jgi:hypothetical protein
LYPWTWKSTCKWLDVCQKVGGGCNSTSRLLCACLATLMHMVLQSYDMQHCASGTCACFTVPLTQDTACPAADEYWSAGQWTTHEHHLVLLCACTCDACRVVGDGSIQSYAECPNSKTTGGKPRRSLNKPGVDFFECELVSPVLKGQQGLEELARALRALNTLPVEVNWRTGLHIHVGGSVCCNRTTSRPR